MSVPGGIQHGGGLTGAMARYGGSAKDWLDLSTGINPNPVALPAIPPTVWHRLPDRALFDAARQAAAHYYMSHGLLPLPVPGTQSVIQLLPRLIEPTARVAVLSPTYGEYERAFRLSGLAVDLIASLDDLPSQCRLVVVVNPNNPTGLRIDRARLLALASVMAARGGFLVVDEAFADSDPDQSLCGDVAAHEGLILFRSFGKFFGLAGLRLGFMLADPKIMDGFEHWLGPWAVSGPALSLADQLLRKDTRDIAARIAERKRALERVLAGQGLSLVGGASLFTLVDAGDAAALHDHLGRQHILVRKFDYHNGYLRFGLTPGPTDDERLATALSGWKG